MAKCDVKKIKDVLLRYNISNKMVTIISDNGNLITNILSHLIPNNAIISVLNQYINQF